LKLLLFLNKIYIGTDASRIEDLHTSFSDKTVNAVLCNRGGYGSYRLLNKLDYNGVIIPNPKPLIGYSDITAIANAIFFTTGLVTFHGPVGIEFVPQLQAYQGVTPVLNAPYMKRLLFDNEMIVFKNSDTITTITIKEGRVKGRLFGGNLSVLTSMVGSMYMPPNSVLKYNFEELILFVEEIMETPEKVDRMLNTLKISGILDKVAGFVFGTCYKCAGSASSFTIEQVVRDYVTVPSMMNVRIGHDGDQWTMPIGVEVEMDTTAGTITMLEKAMAD